MWEVEIYNEKNTEISSEDLGSAEEAGSVV